MMMGGRLSKMEADPTSVSETAKVSQMKIMAAACGGVFSEWSQ